MNEALKIIEKSDSLNDEIIYKALEFEMLKKRQETLEDENGKKLNELQAIRSTLSKSQEDHEDLSNRNVSIREKFDQIDENVKKEAHEITTEFKHLCKKLGIKVLITPTDHETEVKFTISFKESKTHKITFSYDSITEDYDLLKIEPEHSQFDQIKTFLWETKDIQGFLANYRNKILSAMINHS